MPVSDRNVLPYKTRSAAQAAGKPAAKPAAVLAVPATVLAVPAAEPDADTDDKLDDPDFVPPIESESGSEDEEEEEEEELDDEAALLSARLERFDSPVSSKNVISGPRPARAAAVAARAAIEAEVARAVVDVNKDEANDDDWVPCEDGEEAEDDEDDEEELIEAPRVAVAVVATPPAAVLAAAPSAIAVPAPASAPARARAVLLPEDCTRRAALYCSTSKLRAPRSAPVQALVEQPAVVVEQQAAVIVVEQRQTEIAPEPTVVSQAASSAPRRAAPSFDPLTESSERCGDYCALL